MARFRTTMSPRQKAATLMISLGPDVAATVYKKLSHQEVELLTLEITNLKTVQPEERTQVVRDFRDLMLSGDYQLAGGQDYAKEVLELAFGNSTADEVLRKLTEATAGNPFQVVGQADPGQIRSFLEEEHPQTTALVLSYLEPSQSALILSALPIDLQADIIRRIAFMTGTSPEVVSEVERSLEAKLASIGRPDHRQHCGLGAVVQILKDLDRTSEKAILEQLRVKDVGLTEEIRRSLFTFEDVAHLDRRSIQRIIRTIEPTDLQLALKIASDAVRRVIFGNMSRRAVETMKDEMELMGPIRLRDAEAATERIVNAIQWLEETGEILLPRTGVKDQVL